MDKKTNILILLDGFTDYIFILNKLSSSLLLLDWMKRASIFDRMLKMNKILTYLTVFGQIRQISGSNTNANTNMHFFKYSNINKIQISSLAYLQIQTQIHICI